MKNKLIIQYEHDTLSLGLFRNGHLLGFEKILSREIQEEVVAQQIQTFVNGKKPYESVLLLSRSEVIQKEVEGVKATAIDNEIDQWLPCARKEMCYGFLLDEAKDGVQGLLMAIPEKSLANKLEFLGQFGVFPDEVVTDDQALGWLVLKEKVKSSNSGLLLDFSGNGITLLFLHGGRLHFSFKFGMDRFEDAGDLVNEISLVLLQEKLEPERVFTIGEISHSVEMALKKRFSVPFEAIENPHYDKGVSNIIYGGSFFGNRPYISLLPTNRKIERWKKVRTNCVRNLAVSFGILVVFTFSLFSLHSFAQTKKLDRINREILKLKPQVSEQETLLSSLEVIGNFKKANEQIINFLIALSKTAPAQVTIEEIKVQDGGLNLKGESASHLLLADIMQALQKMPDLSNVKLEQSRMRKRLNESYFEFEISALWN